MSGKRGRRKVRTRTREHYYNEIPTSEQNQVRIGGGIKRITKSPTVGILAALSVLAVPILVCLALIAGESIVILVGVLLDNPIVMYVGLGILGGHIAIGVVGALFMVIIGVGQEILGGDD